MGIGIDILLVIIIVTIGIVLFAIRRMCYFVVVPNGKFVILERTGKGFFQKRGLKSHNISLKKGQPGILPEVVESGDGFKLLPKWLWKVSDAKDYTKVPEKQIGIIYAIQGLERKNENLPKYVPLEIFENEGMRKYLKGELSGSNVSNGIKSNKKARKKTIEVVWERGVQCEVFRPREKTSN